MAKERHAPRKRDRRHDTDGLTAKQRRFVEELLVDDIGSKAAIRAGYTRANATSMASKLLSTPHIAKAVAEARASRSARVGLTADEVLRELKLLVLSNVKHYAIDGNGDVQLAEGAPEEAIRALASVKRKVHTGRDGTSVESEFKLWDKPSAVRMAAQHLGLLVEKQEITHKFGHAELVAESMKNDGEEDE